MLFTIYIDQEQTKLNEDNTQKPQSRCKDSKTHLIEYKGFEFDSELNWKSHRSREVESCQGSLYTKIIETCGGW